MKTALLSLLAASAFALTACSAPADREAEATPAQSAAATTDDSALSEASNARAGATGTTAPGRMLTLEGLGELVIGQPVPGDSSFAERGAQINETCRTVSSPDYPGVYALVEDGEVRRITVGERSDVRLAEGIGIGATAADVLAVFPGFRSTPHKYVAAPGRYLTQPGKDPRLRFELGTNGRVSLIHAGLMPQLAYVEGCA